MKGNIVPDCGCAESADHSAVRYTFGVTGLTGRYPD
jgi:hypothetical protein